MIRRIRNQKGFTLVELIAVLILVGFLTALAAFGIMTALQGYMYAKLSAPISEKAELAVSRINRELQECYNCSGTAGTSVSMPVINTLGRRSLTLASGNVQLSDGTNTDILIDQVSSFNLTFNSNGDHSILVTLTMNSTPQKTFTSTVYPRNTAF